MMTRLLPALALAGLLTAPALADQAAADKCAAGLSPDARAVYTAAAPGFASAPDPRALLKDKTRGLVKAGTVSMGNARTAAQSAATCLMKLK